MNAADCCWVANTLCLPGIKARCQVATWSTKDSRYYLLWRRFVTNRQSRQWVVGRCMLTHDPWPRNGSMGRGSVHVDPWPMTRQWVDGSWVSAWRRVHPWPMTMYWTKFENMRLLQYHVVNGGFDPLHRLWHQEHNHILYCLIARENCWLLQHLRQSVNDILVHLVHSETSSFPKHVDALSTVLEGYKNELLQWPVEITVFCLFSALHELAWTVHCFTNFAVVKPMRHGSWVIFCVDQCVMHHCHFSAFSSKQSHHRPTVTCSVHWS